MANEKSVSLMETTLSNTVGSQRTPGSGKPPSAARLDAGLVRAIAVDRNRDAFAELFDRYAPRVRFFAMKMGADGAAADEVVQEAMLAVWRKADTFDPSKASFSTWLYTVARNKRITMLRKTPAPALDPEDPAYEPSAEANQDEVIENSENQERLQTAISQLPGDQAKIVKMSFFEGKAHQEISGELNLPLGTVKSRSRLALAKLRKSVGGTLNA
jgi:RNA polymerase sigma-70 factor (ECF subfamily)